MTFPKVKTVIYSTIKCNKFSFRNINFNDRQANWDWLRWIVLETVASDAALADFQTTSVEQYKKNQNPRFMHTTNLLFSLCKFKWIFRVWCENWWTAELNVLIFDERWADRSAESQLNFVNMLCVCVCVVMRLKNIRSSTNQLEAENPSLLSWWSNREWILNVVAGV